MSFGNDFNGAISDLHGGLAGNGIGWKRDCSGQFSRYPALILIADRNGFPPQT